MCNAANSIRLIDQVAQVNDQRSFIAFVRALQADRAELSTRSQWQHDTIEDYLEAAAAWAEDAPMQLPPSPDTAAIWRTFAHFLYCGKIYE
jgi:hypothetical protein